IGKDASNNISGNTAYTIDFRVEGNNSLSPITAYPNPFVNETAFKFIATGDAVSELSILIYDNFGKLVNKITGIQNGFNDTNVRWDGKDFLGNNVPSGVYYYKINASGDKFDLFNNSGENIVEFQRNYGKIIKI